MANDSSTPVNLSYQRRIEYLEHEKSVAIARIPQYSSVTVTVKKKNKAGEPVLDSDGFEQLVDKKLLARDVEAAAHDDRIREYRAAHPNCRA